LSYLQVAHAVSQGLDNPGGFDPGDHGFRNLTPFCSAMTPHSDITEIHAAHSDPDTSLPWTRGRIGYLKNLQNLRAACLSECNCTHVVSLQNDLA
jgi:hypothetical protein